MYYFIWPSLRLVFLGHKYSASLFSHLPEEIIKKISDDLREICVNNPLALLGGESSASEQAETSDSRSEPDVNIDEIADDDSDEYIDDSDEEAITRRRRRKRRKDKEKCSVM